MDGNWGHKVNFFVNRKKSMGGFKWATQSTTSVVLVFRSARKNLLLFDYAKFQFVKRILYFRMHAQWKLSDSENWYNFLKNWVPKLDIYSRDNNNLGKSVQDKIFWNSFS